MSLRIVFMGTPDFAVPSLRILVQNGYKVAGVVTATDKYGGRGKKQLLESPVKKYAVEQGIPVLQPKNLKSPEFQEDLRALNANLQVVVAFRMLPETVWDMPEYGTFNLHGSLLPRYRGAAPINWAVINGDTETGVTTFFIRHEIDTGDVLLQEKMPIGPNETAGEVHDRMMMLGAETVLKTVQAIESGNYHLQKQDDAQATKAPKLFRETCEIDFDQPVEKVHNFVRGLSPYPAAWTTLEDKQLKILRAHYKKADVEATPGTFRSDNKSWIKIAALDGWLVIEELQLQGRKRMKANDFLNGFSF
ncbi:methionyl-tRNA formyltransferase [Phaeodactylibacter xiamenensis]|uniref:methionyl-tRNA formyltransferase n=1 Tax=Phaeodactylibacter xiamenensis TaxID=1524460 RepID=UPI0024A92CCE|nr:methionyl-tRNA formyltransferase [Phaeodactylibacter xiamenensis]